MSPSPSFAVQYDDIPKHCTTIIMSYHQTLYGRDLNSVLKDNLGSSWEEACATLMCEMRMYELECLRR